ncbi:MAG: hypothetical protein AAF183_24035 [Pseudomonadota bacterium]
MGLEGRSKRGLFETLRIYAHIFPQIRESVIGNVKIFGAEPKANRREMMPKGPQGQRRPADVIGNAVIVAKIATGEIEDTKYKQPAKVKAGKAGAAARVGNTTAEERSEIAKKAASGQWG